MFKPCLIQQHQRAIDTPTFSEAEYAAQIIEVFEEFGAGKRVTSWYVNDRRYAATLRLSF